MNTRKSAAVAGAALAAVLAAGCSSLGGSQPVTYAPAVYGVPGQCYYVSSAAEVTALEAAGLCPSSWAPVLMPLAWHEEYYAYYDSPAYYTVYVPAKTRTVYVHTETSFGSRYKTAITAKSKTATYRSSSGKTVKGTAVTAKTRFGSGKSFSTSGQVHGGGNLRTGTSKSGTGSSKSSSSKSGSSGSSSSRSGSLRSGGYSGSRSRSH